MLLTQVERVYGRMVGYGGFAANLLGLMGFADLKPIVPHSVLQAPPAPMALSSMDGGGTPRMETPCASRMETPRVSVNL